MANDKDDRERKKGVPSISFGRAASKGFAGATGGSGAGAGAVAAAGGAASLRAMLVSTVTGKALTVLAALGFCGAMGVSAYNVGMSMNPAEIARKAFDARQQQAASGEDLDLMAPKK